MDKTYIDNTKAQQIKELRAKIKGGGKKFFLDSSKELFEKNPTLLKFGWTQYTPYYSSFDGEACAFSAELDFPKILLNGEPSEENPEIYDEETWIDNEYYFKKTDKSEEARIYGEVKEFLSHFDDADVENFFGDHCQVIASRDCVEIEEYDHD